MLKNLKMELIGHHHSGIDDCRNITRIAVVSIEIIEPRTGSNLLRI
jgi:inhibitor of KinA sporulation pathway (predicted exonuclease)